MQIQYTGRIAEQLGINVLELEDDIETQSFRKFTFNREIFKPRTPRSYYLPKYTYNPVYSPPKFNPIYSPIKYNPVYSTPKHIYQPPKSNNGYRFPYWNWRRFPTHYHTPTHKKIKLDVTPFILAPPSFNPDPNSSRISDSEVLCYLGRYDDLYFKIGVLDVKLGREHWYKHGFKENRDKHCPSKSDYSFLIPKLEELTQFYLDKLITEKHKVCDCSSLVKWANIFNNPDFYV